MFWTEEAERRLCEPGWLKQLSWAESVYFEKKWGRLQPIHQQSTAGRRRHWLDTTALQQVWNQSAVKLAWLSVCVWKSCPGATRILKIFNFSSSKSQHGNTGGFGTTPRRIKNILAVKQRMLKTLSLRVSQSENMMDLEDSLTWYLGTWQCWAKGCTGWSWRAFPTSPIPWIHAILDAKHNPKAGCVFPAIQTDHTRAKTRDLLPSLQNAWPFRGHPISQIACPLLIMLRMRLLSCINPFCLL